METTIWGACPTKKGVIPIPIFGHSSKGLPGVEIIGLGKFAKLVKEKFIYLSRMRQLRIPMRRVVLCVELEERQLLEKGFEWEFLEFPLLLVFWYLAENLLIMGLEDCVASGKVSINGKVDLLDMPLSFLLSLRDQIQAEERSTLKVISDDRDLKSEQGLYLLNVQGTLENIPSLLFRKHSVPMPLNALQSSVLTFSK